MRTAGVDIGGTYVRVVLLNATGKVVEQDARVQVEPQEDLAWVLSRLHAWGPVNTLGVGLAGVWSPDQSVLTMPNRPAWEGIAVGKRLSHALGIRPTVLWDAHAMLYGVAWNPARQGLDDGLLLSIGTGLMAGVVDQGRILKGTGLAGNVAWWPIGPNGERWEDLVSGQALERHGFGPAAPSLTTEADLRFFAAAEHAVTRGLTLLIQFCHPARIWLAGSVLLAGHYDQAVAQALSCAKGPGLGSIPVLRPDLGPHAGAFGAAIASIADSHRPHGNLGK